MRSFSMPPLYCIDGPKCILVRPVTYNILIIMESSE